MKNKVAYRNGFDSLKIPDLRKDDWHCSILLLVGMKLEWYYYMDIVIRKGTVFYLTMHSAHFIYSYMASDIW